MKLNTKNIPSLKSTEEVKVGALTLGGLVIFLFVISFLGIFNFAGKGYTLNVLYDEVNGLKIGNEVRYAGVPIGKVEDIMDVQADNLQALVNQQECRIKGGLDVSDTSNPKAEELTISFRKFDLNKAEASLPVAGIIDGQVVANGTKDDYSLDGKLVSDSLTVEGYTFDNVQLPIATSEGKLLLQGAKAEYGGGNIYVVGEYDIHSKDAAMFKGTINCQGEVEQKRNRPQITAYARLDDVLLDVTSVPELGEGESNLGFNISLELGPKIHMHNSRFYNLWLAGGLQVLGSSKHPRITGDIHGARIMMKGTLL